MKANGNGWPLTDGIPRITRLAIHSAARRLALADFSCRSIAILLRLWYTTYRAVAVNTQNT